MLLKNKTALITGGSRGIGLEISRRFLQNGVKYLAYFSRNKSEKHGELEELAQKHNATLAHYAGSIDSETDLSNAVQDIQANTETLDILVNNAGVTRDKLIIALTLEDWDTVIGVNLRGVFIASKLVARRMLKQRSGVIVNITSVVGITGNVGQSNYAASKAGIIGFTKSLAKEVAKRGLRVNAIAPGLIQTDMTNAINETYKQKLLEQIPLGRAGEPEDIADPCVFLCSDMARYITGEVLVVSGGML